MSLVDYASSSDDEHEEIPLEEHRGHQQQQEVNQNAARPSAIPSSSLPPPSIEPSPNQNFSSSSLPTSSSFLSSLPPPQLEKLPDASLLFASPLPFPAHQTVVTDHSSRVAAAIAASESRKRESNGSGPAYRRSKEPRGHLPNSRNIPDTVGGKLIPPQLRGRSNVVTEDITKLFVKRDGQNLASGD